MKKFLRPTFPVKSVVLTGRPVYAPPAKLYRVMFAVLVLFWLTTGMALNCSAQSPTATINAAYTSLFTTGNLHTGVAHLQDHIYIEIDNVSEAIQTPVVTIDGQIMNIIYPGTGTHYQADRTLDSSIPNGSITIVVNLTDLAGNTTQTTLIPSFTFDGTPTIIATGTLSALSTNTGTASATTQFSVSTFNLSTNAGASPVTVTAPPGFEVATTGPFGQSVIIRPDDYSPQLVYVRLAAADAGGVYSGDVVLSSPGAASVHVPTVLSSVNTDITSVSLGSANPSFSSSVVFQVNFSGNISGLNTGNFSLSGTASTGAFVDYITGSGNAYQVHVQTGPGVGTLVLSMVNTTGVSSAVNALPYNSAAYNMDRIPPTATISAVYDHPFTTGNLRFGVAHIGDKVYVAIDNVSEAIQSPVVTIDGQIMNIIGSGTHYQADYNLDSNIKNGSITIVVNLTDLAGNTTQTTLIPTFIFDATPTIITTGTLSALSTNTGTASATTQFSVSSFNISDGAQSPVTVTAPPGFEVATTGSFGQSVTFQSIDYSSKPVYVRLAASDAGGVYSGDVVLSSAGAPSVHVPTAASSVATLITSIAARGGGISGSSSVTFDVTFKDNVSGLTADNFSLTTSGVSGANILLVTGAGNNYTVAVNTGTGSGTITLNLANVTGISPVVGNAMPFIGDTYTIDKVPLTVSTTAATNITATSATLANNITPIGSGFVIDCGAVYSTTNTSPTLSDTKLSFATNTFNTGTYSGTATGLSPNTTYYVAAYATNSTGTSYGVPVSFTTASANLSGIGLSAGTLTPGFSATTTGYTASVGSGVSSITITPTASYSNTVITVNGSALTSGSANVNLNPGPNTITILVTADGNVINTYMLTVNRAFNPPGNTLAFDGVHDGVIMGPAPTVVSGNFTVEAWVMPTDATKEMHIFSTRATGELSFDMQIMNGNRIHGDIGNGSVWFTTGADAGFNYKTGQWMHIAYVVTPTGYSIYANGNLVGSGTISGTPLLMDNTHTTTIGCYPGENTYFNGSIDEVRVYNAALSPANIQADMTSTASSLPLSLVNYYDFDNGAAGGTNTGINTLTDRTATGYNGTLSNFALSGTTSNWVESYAMVVPTATDATSIGATGFTANWTAPATGMVTNYLVDVSASSTFAQVISGSPFSTTSTSQAISGLTGGTTYYYRVRADKTSVTGEGDYSALITVKIPVAISSLSIAGNSPTNATTLDYTVTFATALTTPPSTSDFTLTGTATGTINSITGSGTTYDVNVTNVSGNGTLGLDMTSGSDASPTIGNVPFTGGAYIIDMTPPTAIISAPSVASILTNSSGTVTYTITYADANFNTSNLTTAGVMLNTISGNATGNAVVSGSGTSYTVTISNITGVGSLGITLAGGYATDFANNADVGAGPSATFNVLGSNNAYLSTLLLVNPAAVKTIVPGPDAVDYTASVSNATTSIEVAPTTNVTTSTVTVNNATVTSGSASLPIALSVGTNTITTIVTAQDGVTKKTYVITVTRAPSNNAYLSTLLLVNPTAVKTIVSGPDAVDYIASVSNTTTSIEVVPTTSVSTSTVSVNNATVTSGSASLPIALSVGTNTITTVVTAQDGVTKKTYVITVTRAPSNNAYLSSLLLVNPTAVKTIVPGPDAVDYTASVSNETASIEVIPTTNVTTSRVTVNGTAVLSGSASLPIGLSIGSNTITTVVTAQDGVTTKTYVITVTREALSSNAYLSTLLLVNPTAVKTIVSGPDAVDYTASVSNATTSIEVIPATNVSTSTVTVNNATVTSGSASLPIALSVGANTITTVVTAQDGVTKKTYVITVTRATGSLNIVYQPVSVSNPTDHPQMMGEEINVHQGLSPNGDGINDFLMIEGIAGYPDNKLQIMNRSGQLVFEAKGYDNSSKVFDGHSNKNGQMQLPGTYFYSLDYIVKGETRHKTGFIVLKY